MTPGNLPVKIGFSSSNSTKQEVAMGRLWSREHIERRVDRYYLLAAAAKIPEIRQLHIGRARYYRKLLSLMPTLSAGGGLIPVPAQ